MKANSFRSILMTVMILLVLTFGAMLTIPAYADDSVPPPTDTPTEVTPPVEESTPVTAVPAPIVEETAPAADILAQVPEGTDVMIVNADGEALPLATEEAAQALVDGDPMWCPAGVAPSTLNPLCSGAFTGISNIGSGTGIGNTGDGSLAHWLDINDPAKAGVIWIEYNYDGWNGEIDNTITLNGLDFANLDDFALTVQGGWNGVNGNTALNVATPYSTFQEALTITNWTGAITLKNLNFTLANFGGPSDQALQVGTKGAITLDKVNVVNNGTAGAGIYDGALLDNTSGTGAVTINKSSFNNNEGYGLEVNSHGAITLTSVLVNGNDAGGGASLDNAGGTGNVTVSLSSFNSNAGLGLVVNSKGAITLANVLVNGNSAGGAYLSNATAAAAKAVTITAGTNGFSDNAAGDGLNISSTGIITLKDIDANNNGGDGIHLDNRFGSAVAGINFTGTTQTSGNGGDGIEAYSDGAISASNLIANNNINGWGVQLDNSSAATALAVKLTGNNEFKFNGGGLLILSQGAITTNNVTALTDPILFPGNDDGVRLQNDNNFGANVTMTGTNIMTGNFGDGLYVTSNGSITLNNITSSGNENGYGAYLDNSSSATPMAVLLNGTNTFNNNGSSGLEIHTNGTVTLNKVTASDNSSGYGAVIEGTTLSKSVTLNGYGIFNSNLSGGLKIITKGAITLNNITANNNHNAANTAGGIGIQLDNTASTAAFPQNVTINGTNSFSGNYSDGLSVNTCGLILLSNLTANDNSHGFGALIRNEGASLPKSVTLNGYGTFDNNFTSGLRITTTGAITLNNIAANGNTGGYGVQMDNAHFGTSASPQNVTINGTNEFSGNYESGLFVVTRGAILTNNLTANFNGHGDPNQGGVYLDNAVTPKAITLNGVNVITNNNSTGIFIFSKGTITVNKLDADQNVNGAWISNDFTGAIGGLNFTGWVYVEGNSFSGLRAFSRGAINIANLNINIGSPNGIGAILENDSGTGNVTISGSSQIFGSATGGLTIWTNGSVTLSNMTVSGNGEGIVIDHAEYDTNHINFNYLAHPQNVTLTGTNYFYNNTCFLAGPVCAGLKISADGAITINNLDVYGNAGYGVWLENCGYYITASACDPNWSAPKGITITGINSFVTNTGDGLWAASKGAITISDITANFNTGNGATLNNQWGTGSVGGITLKGINIFEGNDQKGLKVNSHGAITISNLSADLNKNDGVSLSNHSVTGATGVAVTLTGVNTFTNNGTAATGSGLVIFSDGQITLSNITATGNKASGASLDNTYISLLVNKPGIKLTGVNNFNQNLSYGLAITSFGVVDLINITADLNGSDGLHATTSGKFTLACGSLNNNGAFGWNVTAGGLITLKGVFGVGNPSGNNPVSPSASVVIIRPCSVPPPVVLKLVVDDERAALGVKVKDDLVYERK